jgi:predicted ArsR family transcriptional regulator
MAVVIANAPSKELYAEALAKPAGTTEVQAGTELRRFEQAGLLDLLPQESHLGRRGRPPKRYAKRRSDVWQFARKLAEQDAKPGGGPSRTA